MFKEVKVINPVNNTIPVNRQTTTIIRSCGPFSRLEYNKIWRTTYRRDKDEIYYSYRRLGFRICLKKLKQ
jgi:hypothetical protein